MPFPSLAPQTPPCRTGALVVVEIAGGVAIGRAAITVVRAGGGPRMRGYVILGFAGLGAIVGASLANPLGFRVGYGIHGALVGAAVGVPFWAFFRWHQGMEDEADQGRVEALATHEGLVTPVRLPTFYRRAAARVLDMLLLFGASWLLDAATGPDTFLLDGTTDAEVWLSILLVWAPYDIVLHTLFGATAGKALCRICVVDAGGAARVGVLRAARRWALGVVNAPLIWLQVAASGDLLWSIDPRLSAMKPVYCGTILITAGERRRLRGPGAVERAAQLAETFRTVRAIPPLLTRRQALVGLALLVAIAWVVIEHPCWVPADPELLPDECFD